MKKNERRIKRRRHIDNDNRIKKKAKKKDVKISPINLICDEKAQNVDVDDFQLNEIKVNDDGVLEFIGLSGEKIVKGIGMVDLTDELKKDMITKENETICIYPPGENDAIEVRKSDLLCLEPNEYLNDTIIDFYLKYVFKELAIDNKRFHFYSSYFLNTYKRKGIKHVCKWTKNINIFDMDFLIFPIVESSHWRLAIICQQEYDEESCIILMDSLYNNDSPSSREYKKTLCKYLEEEWFEKYKIEKIFNLTITVANVPTQNNSTDCGLFLLQYAMLFSKNPPINPNKINEEVCILLKC